MGDVGDAFNDLRQHRKDLRQAFGVECPGCKIERPKTNPTIMLPGQKCKVCKTIDTRPRLTDEQIFKATGWHSPEQED